MSEVSGIIIADCLIVCTFPQLVTGYFWLLPLLSGTVCFSTSP